MKISFAHNVQNRHKTLRETIEMERTFFPESNIYVAYNDDRFNIGYFNDLKNIFFIKYIGDGHKCGCVNGCITSIKQALVDDSDVIVFSHDDVKINPIYIEVFKKNVEDVLNNTYDIICRKPHSYGDNYYMMEGFFINKKIATNVFLNKILFSNEFGIPLDIRKSPSPEVWLYTVFNENNYNIKCIDYIQSNNNYNKILAETLGFHHKNVGIRGWKD